MSWLPRGFEFLSGVPEAERRRRVIVTIQAYVDDTGLDGRGPWFMFSAILGTAEDWAVISDRWKEVLDEPRRIDYFKMDQAVGFSDEFYGFSESERNYKLTRLARATQRKDGEYPLLEQTLTAELSEVVPALKRRSRKPLDNPYFWSFHHLISAIGLSLLEVDYDEPFEIFFDDNVIFGPRAKAWWPVIRAMQVPKLRAILPIDPLFRDDKTTMPLQIADLTAWMSHKDKAGGNDFAWLREHLGITKSPHCVPFGKKEIGLMFGDEGPLPPEMQWRVDAAREAFEETFVKGGARHYVPKPKNRKKHPKR